MAISSQKVRSTVSTSVYRATGPIVLALGFLTGSTAHAALVESVTTSSVYSYDFAPGLAGTNAGSGDAGIFHLAGPNAAKATKLDIDYGTIIAPDASFFFLNNIQCKGFCSIGLTTLVIATITNTGSSAVNVGFNSDITAGHLGLVGSPGSKSSGAFNFDVTQTKNSVSQQLYAATGTVSALQVGIVTSNGSPFNGLVQYQDQDQIGLDWTETPVSVLLGALGAGQSTTVTYRSVSRLDSYGICTALTGCDGVQVAFGDPRNNGGIIHTAARAFGPQMLARQPIGFVLDRQFAKVAVETSAVILPAVPEPASWALVMLGFGMTGAALRRRSALAAA